MSKSGSIIYADYLAYTREGLSPSAVTNLMITAASCPDADVYVIVPEGKASEISQHMPKDGPPNIKFCT